MTLYLQQFFFRFSAILVQIFLIYPFNTTTLNWLTPRNTYSPYVLHCRN